ncbi:methyltransferase domain-containing protein [Xylariales sp. AK1849]|nr:methyltransferase domain-containing protein [Xylariales sp. AK1849]
MPSIKNASLDADTVLEAFQNIKSATDDYIVKNHFETFCADFLPKANQLAIAIFSTVFEELGCPIRSAAPGDKLPRIRHVPKHKKYVDYIYNVLDKNGGLVTIQNAEIIRTSAPCPSADTVTAFEELLRDRPSQEVEIKLMQLSSRHLVQGLLGEIEAVQLLFGSSEGHALMDRLYSTADSSKTVLEPLDAFMTEIGETWTSQREPLRILEVGAGTGGTTQRMLPALAALDGIPVEYTVSDLSAMLVSQTSQTFARYPFARYKVVDIEKEPEPELLNSQHVIFGSNVLHATRDLKQTLGNLHKILRPDGFIVIHEMTAQMLWADVVFGLIEGWWRFEDQRTHVLQNSKAWKKVFEAAGFSSVHWTDGRRPEARAQQLIFAMASDPESMFGS